MSPGSTSGKDADVFPVGLHTEHAYTPNIYTVYHTNHRHSEHSHKQRQHQGPHSAFVSAGQDGSPLVRLDMHTDIHAHIIDSPYTGRRKGL